MRCDAVSELSPDKRGILPTAAHSIPRFELVVVADILYVTRRGCQRTNERMDEEIGGARKKPDRWARLLDPARLWARSTYRSNTFCDEPRGLASGWFQLTLMSPVLSS